MPYYFYEEQLESLMKNKSLSNQNEWSKITIYPINDNFDLNKYCNDNYIESKIFAKATLSMGSYYSITPIQFISKITAVSIDTINFVKIFRKNCNQFI